MGYTNLRGVDRVPVSLVRFVLKPPRCVATAFARSQLVNACLLPDLGYAAELLAGRGRHGWRQRRRIGFWGLGCPRILVRQRAQR